MYKENAYKENAITIQCILTCKLKLQYLYCKINSNIRKNYKAIKVFNCLEYSSVHL